MMMIKRLLLKRWSIVLAGLVLLLVPGSAQSGGGVNLFGPQKFTRTHGDRTPFTETFPRPAWVVAPFQIQVQNGDAQGHNEVSSASITLNGVEVISEATFDQLEDAERKQKHDNDPDIITQTVNLNPQNTLQISLDGKSGSFIILTVIGQNGDQTPPIVAIASPASPDINNPTPHLDVTYSDPAGPGGAPASGVDITTLQVLLDGVDRTSLFTRRSGDASADLPASLALVQGNHTLLAKVKDLAGNPGQASSQFVVDLTPPQLQIIQPAAGSYLPSATPTISLAYSDNVGVDLSSLRVFINGQDRTSLFSKTSTGATATLATALPNGANSISAQISDLAGNQTTATTSFNIDTIAPVISVTHPGNGTRHAAGPIEITLTYSDDQALDLTTLQLKADGNPVPVSAGPGSATASVSGLADGSHSLQASIRDRAGNLGSATSSFIVDTTAPDIHIIQPASGAFLNTSTPAITVDYSDNDAVDTSTLHVFINGTDVTQSFIVQAGAATLAATQPLPDGLISVAAQINDLAGNTGHTGISFTVDTIKPTASFQSPAAQINTNTPLVAFTYSDSGSGINPASVHISLDGSDVTAAFAVGAGSATATLAFTPPLAEGSHQLQGTVADRAGNQTVVTATFFVDTTPPNATFVSPANNSFTNNVTPALKLTYNDGNGTGVDPNSIHIFLQQGTNPETEITSAFQIGPQEADGAISASSSLADGSYALRAVVKDVVGNTANVTSAFEVDTVPPTYRIESPADSSFINTATPTIVIDYQDDRSGVDPARLVVLVDGIDRTSRFSAGNTQATGTLQPSDALADGQHQISVQVFDRAGNEAAVVPQAFTVDTVPPTITPSFSPTPNAQGWNNTPVTITFTCADTGSGVSTCPAPIVDSTDGVQTFTVTATDAAGNTATATVVVKIALVPPSITASVSPTPNAAGWNNTTPVTVTFVCTPGSAAIASCTGPQTVSSEGVQQISGSAVDIAGFTASTSVTVQLDVTPPIITANVAPAPGPNGIITAASATVTFTCSDNLSGVLTCPPPVTVTTNGPQTISGTAADVAGNTATASAQFNLQSFPPLVVMASISPAPNAAGWNNSPVTVTFQCTGGAPPVSCPSPQTVNTDGAHQVVTGTGTDAVGSSVTASATVNLDQTPPLVTITSPADRSISPSANVPISGLASDALSGLAAVTCNGSPATISGGSFTCSLQITQGALGISVQATDVAGNNATTSVNVNLQGPKLTITSPAPLGLFSSSSISVTGTVDDPAATITVNGVQGTNNGATFTAQSVVLREGNNLVTATGTNAGGAVGTASVNVVLDTTPPTVTIDSPSDKAVLTTPQIYVTGLVNDIVTGTVNSAQVTVSVNGVKADVGNRSFMAEDVLLVPGQNVITAVATDRAGNVSQSSITVTLQDAGTQQRILMVSGNGQSGAVGSTLSQPLVVEVVNSVGQPVPNVPLAFTVAKSDGQVTAFPQQGQQIMLQTDGSGQASVNFKLGTRVGNGNNQVTVTSPGFVGEVMFCASATVGSATQIHDIAGGSQTGVIGQPLPEPLVAGAFDASGNPVSGVQVTFKIEQGGGKLEGNTTVTKTTDSDGRAAAILSLAQEEGVNNNVVSASFTGLIGTPAIFTASGKTPGNPASTTVTGLVLDNANQPIPNATASIQGSNLSALTDVNGRFAINNPPVGSIVLFVDGSTSTRTENFPFLEFPMVTVAGQDNHLPGPIYLPPLDNDNSQIVGGDEDVTLTLKNVPGVAYTVFAHSATFPDGTKVGRLTLSQVHADKVPMIPPNGTAPTLVGTLQPSRVKFNPPIRVQLPNTDGMAPGQVTELFSFHHDLEQFVSEGTMRVSPDGSVVVSDPGFGLTVSGWHGGGGPPPPPTCGDGCGGEADDCNDAQCENGVCVTTPTNDGGDCGDGTANQQCGQNGTCDNGSCVFDSTTANGTSCTPEDKCIQNAKCQDGQCDGDPFKPKEHSEISGGISLPPDIRGFINNFLAAWVASVEIDEVEANVSDKKKDCCSQDTGPITDGIDEKAGSLSVKIAIKGHFFGPPNVHKTIGISQGLEVNLDIQIGIDLGVAVSLEGKGGHRSNQCETGKDCFFGEVNGGFTASASGGITILGCLETFTGRHCLQITPLQLGAEFPVKVGASINKEDCDEGKHGWISAGALKLSIKAILDIGLPITFQVQKSFDVPGTTGSHNFF